jgi:DTW domain-containing protein YfiP
VHLVSSTLAPEGASRFLYQGRVTGGRLALHFKDTLLNMGHSRIRSLNRCLYCHMRKVLCICELAPKLKISTKIIVLLHMRERSRPTNTGRLLKLPLPEVEVRIRGDKDLPMNSEGLVTEDRETLLFYPSERAVELSTSFLKTISKPITLIVPDGSWRQASKVPKRVAALKTAIHVKLPQGPVPQYRLRKETKLGGMSTFEAVARALGIIEGFEVQEKLEKLFKILAERTLWSRAKLLITDCETEIPRNAYD